ncbi:PREDICTED: somatomedin-B and thrombospondin type-1 domain-containing protein-like [Chinchilla lanigera]|uniref:somatomedin-B and thrombospondin type-1 domain-containing protein-like n=1 Tax=Chinchilla lanigera TaxID=34839 RepID=UPI00038ED549|nr:PREDICTED: somatomedin-B and thrombospondin type-1 domain-containing protein-like [Chinchilla lanigera]
MWPALLLLLRLSPVSSDQDKGNCSHPEPLCCVGFDNNCWRETCFCDNYCLEVSDCCLDYSAVCGPAPLTSKMVLHVVLRTRSLPGPGRSDPDWVQSTVQRLLQSILPVRPRSISVKGVRKRA